MTLSPKQELIVTLDAAWKLVDAGDPPAVRLAMMRGVLDHARALAQRVGEVAKPRRPVTESPHTLTGHERAVAAATLPLEGGGA